MSTQPDLEPGGVPDWTIGWRLQRALAHASLTPEEMADKLQVHRTTVSRWTNENGSPPRQIYIRQWAMLTGTSANWLCHGDTGPCFGTPGKPFPADERTAPGTRSRSNYMQSSYASPIASRAA